MQLPVVGWQLVPGSQEIGVPGTQVPPEQLSPTVHMLPSSQPAVLLSWTQPLAALHESSVQTLPSSQLSEPPPL
jgi:hypothetical protein